jgi:subfamily B ATP-binding cassette protein MsbA
MTALALLSSMLEGMSLTLIIPLVQTLSESSGPYAADGLLALLQAMVSAIPEEMRLPVLLSAILFAVITKSVVSYANMAVLGIVYGRLSHGLRTAVFSRILATPLAEIERERSGKLLSILDNETWRAADAVNYLFTMVTSFTTVMVFVVILVLLSWKLTLIAVLCMVFLLPLVHVIALQAKKISKFSVAAHELLAQQTWSALNGLRTIHCFGRENFEVQRFNAASDQVRHLFVRTALVSMTSSPVTEIFVAAIVGLLVLAVHGSQLGISVLVGFLAILYRLQPRLLAIVSAQSNLISVHASVGAVSELLDNMAARTENRRSGRHFSHLRDSISFKNVTFTYPGSTRPALLDVSFAIRRGTMVAVTGASGAGKSTLLDVLLRFQRPQRGSVVVDGVPLDEIALADWRDRIGVVSQDPYVFDATIRANITFGRLEASESEMVEAARFAGADDFIRELPNGYDTIVGERGSQISGGERQRIGLARALLRDPDILLLDEATNALDTLTERAFQQTLKRFAESRAVVVVAHRLSTVLSADVALVLEDGKIVERGHPGQLLEAKGLFASMFSAAASNAEGAIGSVACLS